MKVMILVGSGTRDSRSLHLGVAIAGSLRRRGMDPQVVDLLALDLPSFNVDTDRSKQYDEKTGSFLERSRQADAFVWVTPVYHGSYSSILKNALDWQHFFLEHKVIGLASNGSHRGTTAVDHLLAVARAQHGIILPTRICTDQPDYDEQRNLQDPGILARLEHFCEELVDFAGRFTSQDRTGTS